VRSSLEPLKKEENRLTEDSQQGHDGSSGGNLSLPAMVLHTEGMSGIIAEDMATI
jgi:hypothetical protein